MTYKLEGFSDINEKGIGKKVNCGNMSKIVDYNQFCLNQSSQCISYNKKFEHVVVGLDNGYITIRKSPKNLKLKVRDDLKISEKSIISIKFSPDDSLLAVISEDEKLTFLKVENNYPILFCYCDLNGIPIEIDWDNTSNYIQVNNINGEYFIYKIDRGKILGK